MVASDKKNRTRKIFEFAIAVMVGLRIRKSKDKEKYREISRFTLKSGRKIEMLKFRLYQ